ncbi:MAG: PAS domain S-box protein [Phycisphaerae bacterium]|jgi:PAS domain S-box-containing protein
MTEPPDDAFFHNMCLHAGVALIATDAQLRIRFWNPAATRMLGGTAEGMAGRPIGDIVPEDRRELAERLCERTLNRGDVGEFEFDYRRPSGEALYLAVTLSPIVAADGRRVGVSVYLRDVTRRMELERSMAEAQKMSALGQMAGQVAHHFNSLLGGMIIALEYARNSDNPDLLCRAVDTTLSALTRACRLTQGLLAFAQGDRSQCALGDLSEVVGQFAADLSPKLAAAGIRLELDIEPVAGCVPTQRIITVLEHLTANAREAMPDGGALRIELKALPGEPKAVLRVADTGCGIPAEHLPHVFEPFYTTKSGGHDLENHAGLGLAVVHGIVKEMGGTVSLCSSLANGTVCSIVLPLSPGPGTAP